MQMFAQPGTKERVGRELGIGVQRVQYKTAEPLNPTAQLNLFWNLLSAGLKKV